MKEIAEGLDQHFSELKVETKSDSGSREGDSTKTTNTAQPPPSSPPVAKDSFAIVDSVTEGGPADECGLREKDELVEFGSLNAKNFQNLQQLAEIAQHKLDQKVAVMVKRKRDNGSICVETIQLVPKKWAGRGFLGMVIKPIGK